MTYVQAIGSSRPGGHFLARQGRSWPVMAVALLMILAGGCVRSLHPVLTDEQVVVDKSLAGKWVQKDGESSVEIIMAEDAKTFAVLYTEKGGKQGRFQARLGKIGDVLVAELHPADPLPDAADVYKVHLVPVYSFLVVSQTKPELVVSLMKDEWLKKYLDEHPKALQFINPKGDEIVVTSPTADLQAFLAQHWKTEGAFGDPATFVRPDTAPKPAAPAK